MSLKPTKSAAKDKARAAAAVAGLLGEVISSALDYDNLITLTGDPKVINPRVSLWVPSDGRSIEGSRLEARTGMKTAPDMRGKFQRGLNTIYSVGQPLPFDNYTKGDPQNGRVLGDFQKDDFASHSHSAQSSSGFAHAQNWGMGIQSDAGQQVDFSAPGITIGPTGGADTRPRNIALYYYIKIN